MWHHRPVRFTTTLLRADETATSFRVPAGTVLIDGARADETRLRRIEKAIATLHEGRSR
jgi:hypothetical protein